MAPSSSTEPAVSIATYARDARLIVAARGLRSFGYGMVGVVLGVALSRAGLPAVAIGALITVSLAGDFCNTYVVGVFADRWGRRRTLTVLGILMALTGAVFGVVTAFPVLLVAAFFGTLGASASETAPFLPIEQAMLPQTGAPQQRVHLFARYNLVASFGVALGALAAGLPDLLARYGISVSTGIRLLFGIYVLVGLGTALLASQLSPAIEAPARKGAPGIGWRRLVPPLGRSRGIVLRLSALFSLDAFAGGFIVQSLLALFFALRYGVPLAWLGVLFFAANTLSALSYLVAARLARRFGLLNTMVFTHLPSNVLLVLVALMPTFPLAALLLLARQTLSQMDVPTRQAFTMALVAPDERTAAASVTSLARSAGASASPIFAGLLLQGPLLALGLPLIVAGTLKAVQDLSLWAVFRRVRVEET
ncbi:MAG TPA: MFS transporter [Ktedonobacterales bacterium]